MTVGRYRDKIAETLSKGDKKKLELLEHYSDKEIKDMLTYIANTTKKEVNETLSEPGYLKF